MDQLKQSGIKGRLEILSTITDMPELLNIQLKIHNRTQFIFIKLQEPFSSMMNES